MNPVTVHAILPAAGLATRMRGLPKFALPVSAEYETLLERHVRSALEVVDTVWVPTRPEHVALVRGIVPDSRVVVIGMEKQSMSETVLTTAALSGADRYVLGMPDTYLLGESPYPYLAGSSTTLALAAWPIRENQRGKLGQLGVTNGLVTDVVDKDPRCQHDLAWGAVGFHRSFLDHVVATEPHIGYAIPKLITTGVPVLTMSGEYYDCGTPAEYFELLRRIGLGAQ